MIFLATQKDVMIRHFQWILDLKRDTEWQKKESPFNLTDDSPLVAGTHISWLSILSVRNGRKGGGLTMKSSDHFVIFLLTFLFVFESKHSTLPEMQKACHPPRRRLAFTCSGDIELSNLDAFFDRSRQSLIWEGLIVVIEKLAQIE